MIRTQGQPKKKGPEPPKALVRWYLVLMTHGNGNVLHKADTYRGIDNKNVAEALIAKGLIDKEGLRELPEGYLTVKTNPAEAMPEGGKKDTTREILNNAAKTAWKPGMKIPPRRAQPTGVLAREEALAGVDAELNALAGDDPDSPPEPPADFVEKQLAQVRKPPAPKAKGAE